MNVLGAYAYQLLNLKVIKLLTWQFLGASVVRVAAFDFGRGHAARFV